jgi:hypothetical protein
VKGNIFYHDKTRKASNSVVSGYYGIWVVYSDVLHVLDCVSFNVDGGKYNGTWQYCCVV